MAQACIHFGSFVLCADDFGISPGVSRAIVELLEQGRISATSCMVDFPEWPEQAAELKQFAGRADIGLHLTLTDQVSSVALSRLTPAGVYPCFRALMGSAMMRRLPLDDVRHAVMTQIDRFAAAMGRHPDFIDGHQHVHQLPGVRDVLVEVIASIPAGYRPYLRVTCDRWERIFARGVDVAKACFLDLMGRRLRSLARQAGVPVNDGFSGAYRLETAEPFAAMFGRLLTGVSDRSIVMCHPGIVDAKLSERDCFTNRRAEEFEYLGSAACETLFATAGVRPGRFPRASHDLR